MKDVILHALEVSGVSDLWIAHMATATASTTAGATVTSASFAGTIVATGVSAVWGTVMINSGATVPDHLPHGSFFHAAGWAMEMNIKERLKPILYETNSGYRIGCRNGGRSVSDEQSRSTFLVAQAIFPAF